MLRDYFQCPKTGGGGVHFKTKLLEIGSIFFILNSMQMIYNDNFIWLSTLFQISFFLIVSNGG